MAIPSNNLVPGFRSMPKAPDMSPVIKKACSSKGNLIAFMKRMGIWEQAWGPEKKTLTDEEFKEGKERLMSSFKTGQREGRARLDKHIKAETKKAIIAQKMTPEPDIKKAILDGHEAGVTKALDKIEKKLDECARPECTTLSSEMKKCSKCFVTYYCSKDCQKTHWPAHRPICKALREPPPSEVD